MVRSLEVSNTPTTQSLRTRGVGRAGTRACAGGLRLTVEVHPETGVIEHVAIESFCKGAEADHAGFAAALLGQTVDVAVTLDHRFIAGLLGNLPQHSMHQAVLAHEALHAAVADYRGEPAAAASARTIACSCFVVREATIARAIRMNALKTVAEVTHFTQAAASCGSCSLSVETILARVHAEMVAEGALHPGEAFQQPVASPASASGRRRVACGGAPALVR